MIGKLTGILDSASDDQLLLDVQGVGYVVFCSARTRMQLPEAGQTIALRIETQVREDAITLFGFASAAEQGWFKLLTTVQGVAAKMALALLSSLSPQELATAIAAQDKTLLTRAKGVGPKLAARIVTELKDKAPVIPMGMRGAAVAATAAPVAPKAANEGGALAQPEASHDQITEDTISALTHLGYSRVDAYRAVTLALGEAEGEPSVASLVPEALRKLSA